MLKNKLIKVSKLEELSLPKESIKKENYLKSKVTNRNIT